MEHKGDKTIKQSSATATFEGGESKNASKVLDKLSAGGESKGVLGSVWSAAGAIAESVQQAVHGTIGAAYQTADRIQHDAEAVSTVGEYLAHKVVEQAASVYDKTLQTAESVLPARQSKTEEPEQSGIDSWLSSPTNDFMEAARSSQPTTTEPANPTPPNTPATPSTPTTTATTPTTDAILADASAKVGELIESAKQAASDTLAAIQASDAYEAAKQVVADTAARTGQAIGSAKQMAGDAIEVAKVSATETAKQGIESIQATGPFNLVLTMDVVAHLQRIADRTGDKILHETARKAHSACAKGVSDAPGVHLVRITPEQATELVNLAIMTQDHELADFARYCQSVAATTQIGIEPSPGKIQEELAKGRAELSQQGRVHTGPGYGAAFASVGRAAPASALTSSSGVAPIITPASPLIQEAAEPAAVPSGMQLTMDMVAHIQRIADRTGDKVLHDTARKAHSACAKNLSEAPGVHLVSVTPDQASELVNLAIRTQDHELANFARYCQSVAATTQIGIEPTPGKIVQEINKGRQELLQQGRAHTGPGYGAAFASISRSNSAQSLGRTSRSVSPTNIPLAPVVQQQPQPQPQAQAPIQPNLQLTMDVVAHLQRIADRTGDAVLHETARKAHSACAKSVNEAPGVHLTWITPDQATELVNLAIRTQDHELADFARYCQSVAATTQIGVEPSPGKIQEEISKGRQELLQLGRAHTGPGYGAAFASAKPQLTRSDSQTQTKVDPTPDPPMTKTVLPSVVLQTSVGQPSQ